MPHENIAGFIPRGRRFASGRHADPNPARFHHPPMVETHPSLRSTNRHRRQVLIALLQSPVNL